MLRRLSLICILVGLGIILWKGSSALGSTLLLVGGGYIFIDSFRKWVQR